MKRVQKRTQETEARIREVAGRMFREQGFDAVSVDAIAENAEVAKGTVFAHFGDKNGLLAAVGLVELQGLLAKSNAMAERVCKKGAVDDVLTLYQPWLDFFAGNVDFAKLYLNQAGLGNKGPWTEQFIASCCGQEHAVEGLIAAWRKQGAITRKESDAFLAEGAQSFFYSVLIYRLSERTPDRKSQRNALRDFLKAWLG